MGRLLMETGAISDSKLNEVRSYSEAKSGSFEPAFLLDAFEFERTHELTLDYTLADFEFHGVRFRGVDTPGHREFLHKMLSGAFEVDWFLLLVDVTRPLSIENLRHCRMLEQLGISRGIVCLNKVDQASSPRDLSRIEEEVRFALSSSQINVHDYIPLSAKFGQGIDRLLFAMTNLAKQSFVRSRDPVSFVQGIGSSGDAYLWPPRDPSGSWVFKRRGLCSPTEVSQLSRGDYLAEGPLRCSDRLSIRVFDWREPQQQVIKVQLRNAEVSGVLMKSESSKAHELRLDEEVWYLPFRKSRIAGSFLLKDDRGPFGAGVIL